MWKAILGIIGALVGTPAVLLTVAHIWAKMNAFDPKSGRYVKGRDVHPVLTIINEFGRFCEHFFKIRLVNIKQQPIMQKALRMKYDHELFGIPGSPNKNRDDDFLELLQTALQGFQESTELSESGRFFLNSTLFSLMASREKLVNYMVEHRDEILKSEIVKPIFVTGFGRGGTTLVQNLLAQDPNARGIKHWEVVWYGASVPPPTREQIEANPPQHRKFVQVKSAYDVVKRNCPKFVSEFEKSHPMELLQYEEELPILQQAGLFHLLFAMAGPKYFELFHKLEGKETAYLYLKRWLQMMQTAYKPESHWVLKAPVHTVFLPVLKKIFPDARIIVCHRKMDVLIPSGVSLFENFDAVFLKDGYDRWSFGQTILEHGNNMRNHTMDFRKTWDHPEDFFDVQYNNLVEDPISVVKQIYEQWGLEYTQAFEDRMKVWLENNKQGKHGRHEYSLEMYNLNWKELEPEWREYTQTYLEKNEKVENRKHDTDRDAF